MKSFAFLLRIDMSLDTLREVILLLSSRKIVIVFMEMHATGNGEAQMQLRCVLERDRARRVWHLLEKINGVLGVEMFEGQENRLSLPLSNGNAHT